MRARVLAAGAALLASAQAFPASCLSECAPSPGTPYPTGTVVGSRQVCPLGSKAPNAYLVSLAGAICPAGCSSVATAEDCENAASWLALGADGEGACPTAEQLVGAGGLWDAAEVNSPAMLSGCSWRPKAVSGKLSWNTNANALEAGILGDFRICECPSLAALPMYVPVVAGAMCPGTLRDMAMGNSPTCAPLTAEGNCVEAASATHLDLPDKALELCTADCDGGSPIFGNAINSPETGAARPAGCHYRYKPSPEDDSHLWFNPHYNASWMAEAKAPGEGVAPDYLLCGCGDVAPYIPQNQGCRIVGTNGRSKACGVGQYCAPTADGFQCTCEFPLSTPDTGKNGPAQCREEIPTKYISWVSGTECPFDEHTQCLPPPTRERCEHAATMLGLGDTTASLPHSDDDAEAPAGCHYQHGHISALRYNPNATGNVAASTADSLICECVHYPMYIPVLAGVGCGDSAGACSPADTRFECGLAADHAGIPVPEELGMSLWNTTLCILDPAAGPSSPYLPCGHPQADDCTAPGAQTRRCTFTDAGQGMVVTLLDIPAGSATPLDGCTFHADPGATGSPLWFYNASQMDASAANSNLAFRLCDCADETLHNVIAPRLGFECVGPGDCAKGVAPAACAADDDLCVMVGGVPLLRADRFECTNMPTQMACEADAAVCKWEAGACDWRSNTFAGEGEVPAVFSDCLEHCLLLCHCTGVSFFTNENASSGSVGGCDFFSGVITQHTNESIKRGKGQGDWKCWRNIPESPPTPAPTYDCPQCNAIPGASECRNVFGCAWSSAGYCCCDPFVSACTHSWHTNTNTQASCESTSDDGRQCMWIQGQNNGICELPITACVDVYADITVGTNLADASVCVGVIDSLKQLYPEVAAGCGTQCNVSASGPNTMVSFALDLSGNRSCGQATRWSAKVSNALDGAVNSLGGFPVISHNVRSACWEDCATNPLCPKGPTAAPTPVGGPSPTGSPRTTLPPERVQTSAPENVQQDVPTTGPTQSPQANRCPVTLNTQTSDPQYQCRCDTFDCEDTLPPFLTSDYKFCGKCDPRLNGATQFTCPVCTPDETQFSITCPNTWEACDLFFVVYHQAGCSGPVNGGFVNNLPGEEWTSSSCLPKFCGNSTCDERDTTHNTVTLHKQIAGGDTEPVPALSTDPTMFFSLIVDEGRLCPTKLTQAACEGSVGLCQWKDGQCVTFLCDKSSTPGSPNPGREPGDNQLCCMQGTPGGDCVAAANA